MKWGGRNKDWRKETGNAANFQEKGRFLDAVPNLMGTSKKGGLFLEVGSDVDGDLRRLCRVSVLGGHKASRASLECPALVSAGHGNREEKIGGEKRKRELQDTCFGQDRAGTLMYVCYRR